MQNNRRIATSDYDTEKLQEHFVRLCRGTEDVYKIYAESFLGAEHLRRVQRNAKRIVDAELGGA